METCVTKVTVSTFDSGWPRNFRVRFINQPRLSQLAERVLCLCIGMCALHLSYMSNIVLHGAAAGLTMSSHHS